MTDMFEAGASGYLLKECASAELQNAMNAVLANEIYISPKVAGIVLDDHMKRTSGEQSSTVVLTEKECEVLRLLASGKSTKEIALRLEKSVQMIDVHRRRIMDKLETDNMADLVKYAIREGLTTLEF